MAILVYVLAGVGVLALLLLVLAAAATLTPFGDRLNRDDEFHICPTCDGAGVVELPAPPSPLPAQPSASRDAPKEKT